MELPEQPLLDLETYMKVSSVQELAKESPVKIPPRYVRVMDEGPATDVSTDGSFPLSVPVIDLERLVAGDSMDSELEKLHSACRDWGFFQIVNHRISNSLLEGLKLEIEKLFQLSYEQKKKLWKQPNGQGGFGQSFELSEEQRLDWSDMFVITTLPHYLRNNALFDNLPPSLRDPLEIYSNETKRLGVELLSHMAKALKIDKQEMEDLFSDGLQGMRMNYYPPCPEPEKAIGITPHSDSDALTILFQINEIEGLQIRKAGRWVPVKPLPNAFVVNIGDIMEIMSNGVYKSIEHRAMVNSTKERISIATFYSPKPDSIIGPSPSLIGPHNPPIFQQVPLNKYYNAYFTRKVNSKSYLDEIRMENA